MNEIRGDYHSLGLEFQLEKGISTETDASASLYFNGFDNLFQSTTDKYFVELPFVIIQS